MNVFMAGVFLFLLQNIIFGQTLPVLENHLKMLYNATKDAGVNASANKKVDVLKSPRQDEDGGDEGNLVSSIAQTLTGVANNVLTDNFKFGNALAESAQILPGDAGETVSGFLNSVAEPINAVVGNPFQQFQEYLDQNFPITTSTPKPKPKAPTTKAPTIRTTKAPTVSHVFFVHQAPTTNLPTLIPIKPSPPNKSGASSLAASISSLPINSNGQGGGGYKRPIHSPIEEPKANIIPAAANKPNSNSPAISQNPPVSNLPPFSKTEGASTLNSNVAPNNPGIAKNPQFSDIATDINTKNNKPVFSSKPLDPSQPAASSNNLINSNMPTFSSTSVSSNNLIVSNSPTFSKNPIGSNPPTFSGSNSPTFSGSNSPTFSKNPIGSNSPTFSKNPIGSSSPTFSKNPIGSNSPTFSKNPIGSNSPTFSGSNPPTFSGSNPPTFSGSNSPTFSKNPIGSNPPTFSGSNPPTFSGSNSPTFSGSNSPTFSKNPIGSNPPTFSGSNPPTSSGSSSPTFSGNAIGSNSPTFFNPSLGSYRPVSSNPPSNLNNPTFSSFVPGISNANKPVTPNKQQTQSTSKFSQVLLNNNQPTTTKPLGASNSQSFSELLLAGNRPTITNSLLREQSQPQISNELTVANNVAENQISPALTNTKNAASLNQQISNANVQSIFNSVSHEEDGQRPVVTQSLNAISAVMSNNAGNIAQVTSNSPQVQSQNSVPIPNNNPANFRPPPRTPNQVLGGGRPNYNGTANLRPNNYPQALYPVPPPPGDEDEDGEDEDGEDGDANRVAKAV